MKFDAVRLTHGSTELGKDIVFRGKEDLFGDIHYYAVVAKPGNMTASVNDDKGAMTILNQVRQCFNEPITIIENLPHNTYASRVIIACSGKIKQTAINSIKETCRKENLDKVIIFLDGERLVPLLDH